MPGLTGVEMPGSNGWNTLETNPKYLGSQHYRPDRHSLFMLPVLP